MGMTTFGETVYSCPVCEEEVQGKVLHSTNQMGQDTDFCPITMGFHAVPLVIQACLNCGYAGYADDFHDKDFSPMDKLKFLDARVADGLIPLEARLENLSPDHAYYLAYLTKRHFGGTHGEQGDLLLKASWCLRLEGGRPRDDVAAARYRREAIREFRAAIEDEEEGPDSRHAFLYLVAELHRRLGEFDQAAGHFERFLRIPPDDGEWVRAVRGLLARARSGDASNFSFEEILRISEPSGDAPRG